MAAEHKLRLVQQLDTLEASLFEPCHELVHDRATVKIRERWPAVQVESSFEGGTRVFMLPRPGVSTAVLQ
jgi:hypothetical protein